MKIAIKLFAAARELTGADEIAVDAAEPVTIGELRLLLAEQCPEVAPLAARSMMALNAQYCDDAARVSPDDEIALIPPVSGG